MAAMGVQILTRKLIKPSNATPQHLQNFKLSLFDEFTPPTYINIIFYYLPTTEHFKSHNKAQTLKLLEESLSGTLIDFYPLTGRFNKENLLVDCRDQGTQYLHAKVNADLKNFLETGPNVDVVEDFLPKSTSNDDSPLLSIQVNLFDCGGIVFGLRVFHQVADTSTIVSFINTWARRCREEGENSTLPSFTSTLQIASLFPAAREYNHESLLLSNEKHKIVTKRLVFSGERIVELKSRFRGKYGSSIDDNKQPSRVTIVSAIIWKAFISICSARNSFLKPSVLAPAMNLRSRVVNVTLSDNTFGNFWVPYMATFKPKNKNTIELDDIVHHLVNATIEAESCAKGSIDSISLAMGNAFKEVFETMGRNEMDVFPCTSWCGFNMYGADFGWGNPAWVSCSGRSLDMLTLLDTKCGKGIEAWVPLNEEDMDLFQIVPEIAELDDLSFVF